MQSELSDKDVDSSKTDENSEEDLIFVANDF
jgi:hypothetical protein